MTDTTHIRQEDIPESTYVGRDFSEAVFDGVNFGDKIFENCEFRNVVFRDCTAAGEEFPAMFLRCSMQGVSYRRCRGTMIEYGCDFAGAEEDTEGSFSWVRADGPGQLLSRNCLDGKNPADLIKMAGAAVAVTAITFVGCLTAACYMVN